MRRSLRWPLIAVLLGSAMVASVVSAPRPALARPASCPGYAPFLGTLVVHSKGFRVQGSTKVPSGIAWIRYINDGGIWSGVQLSELNPGTSRAAVVRALKHGNEGYYNKLTVNLGGLLGPSGGQLIHRLGAGTYVLQDTEHGAHGKLLVAYRFFVVYHVPTGCAITPLPTAAMSVRMTEFTFHMPAAAPRGLAVLVAFHNAGKQNHMWAVFTLLPGKTVQDVLTYLKSSNGTAPPTGQPPATPYGGLADLSPGKSALISMRFAPGNYVAMCFDRDPKTHQPHVLLGMIAAFAVS